MSEPFKPVVYLKEGCPYSKKLLDFLTRAQLTQRVEIVTGTAGTPAMEAIREQLSAATGQAPRFPTVEVEPGSYRSESDELIGYFSQKYQVGAQ